MTAETQRCLHGFVVNECPHTASVCNFSRDYTVSLSVPPPGYITPKQAEWEAKQTA